MISVSQSEVALNFNPQVLQIKQHKPGTLKKNFFCLPAKVKWAIMLNKAIFQAQELTPNRNSTHIRQGREGRGTF